MIDLKLNQVNVLLSGFKLSYFFQFYFFNFIRSNVGLKTVITVF